jgi:hypothetical protein
MRTRHAVAGAVAVLLACALILVGCGGGVGGSNQPGVKPPDVSAAHKQSINDSSVQDVAATLHTNQVNDPEKWARVIMQYRPYPSDDPHLGKLRQVLADNHADPRTIDQITAVLQP